MQLKLYMTNVSIDGKCIRIVFIFTIHLDIPLLLNRHHPYICLKVHTMLEYDEIPHEICTIRVCGIEVSHWFCLHSNSTNFVQMNGHKASICLCRRRLILKRKRFLIFCKVLATNKLFTGSSS